MNINKKYPLIFEIVIFFSPIWVSVLLWSIFEFGMQPIARVFDGYEPNVIVKEIDGKLTLVAPQNCIELITNATTSVSEIPKNCKFEKDYNPF